MKRTTIRIANVSMTATGTVHHGNVLVMFVPSVSGFEDRVRPETMVAHQVWMPAEMWGAIVAIAGVTAVADSVQRRVLNMDMLATGEPFSTLNDVRGAVTGFVYKLGLRVTTTSPEPDGEG